VKIRWRQFKRTEPSGPPSELLRAYGRHGEARSGEADWRGLERPGSRESRHPILSRQERRRRRWRALNGWVQILLVTTTLAAAYAGGFIHGALWEMSHWVGGGTRR